MTFSMQVKNEIVEQEVKKPCCQLARLWGLLLFGGTFTPEEIRFSTTNYEVLHAVTYFMKKWFAAETYTEIAVKGATISYHDEGLYERMQTMFAKPGLLESPCCKRAFIQGAFLAGGSVTDPQKAYYLEITTHLEQGKRSLEEALSAFDLTPRITKKKAIYVLYFQSTGEIEDLLNVLGAHQSMMEFLNLIILREQLNATNRRVNCDNANVDKALAAAEAQLDAIRKLQTTARFTTLPDTLKEVAEARLANPEATLAELAQLLQISKSGANHRLKRLIDAANS